MKMTYINPEIKKVIINAMQLLAGSPKMDFKEDPVTKEEEEVDDFDQLL